MVATDGVLLVRDLPVHVQAREIEERVKRHLDRPGYHCSVKVIAVDGQGGRSDVKQAEVLYSYTPWSSDRDEEGYLAFDRPAHTVDDNDHDHRAVPRSYRDAALAPVSSLRLEEQVIKARASTRPKSLSSLADRISDANLVQSVLPNCSGSSAKDYLPVKPVSDAARLPGVVNTGNAGQMVVQPGDWICPKCDWVNWRRRESCMKCGRSGHARDEYDGPTTAPFANDAPAKRGSKSAASQDLLKRARSDASSSVGPLTPEQRSSQRSSQGSTASLRTRLDHAVFEPLASTASSQSSTTSEMHATQIRQWPPLHAGLASLAATKSLDRTFGPPTAVSDHAVPRRRPVDMASSLKAGLPSSFLEQVWEQRGFGMLDLGYRHA